MVLWLTLVDESEPVVEPYKAVASKQSAAEDITLAKNQRTQAGPGRALAGGYCRGWGFIHPDNTPQGGMLVMVALPRGHTRRASTLYIYMGVDFGYW